MIQTPEKSKQRRNRLWMGGIAALPLLVWGIWQEQPQAGAGLPQSPVQNAHPPHRPLPPPQPFPADTIRVKSVTVNATVRDGVAETEVSHIFYNASSAPQEGDFVFPIPEGGTVSSFAMYDGETRLEARLLDREEATATYEEIVRRRRDPALLTYQGRAALRARVFPIAPRSERRLTLKLVTVLPREGDAKKYAWTLVGPYLPGNQRPESLQIRVTFDGSAPVGNLYSPTHEVRLRRDSETKVVASWQMDSRDPMLENREFALYATPGKGSHVALSLLAYNDSMPQLASLSGAMRQSGYFMVVASPTIPDKEARENALPRRVVMVMDRSGSMQGKKIEQAKGALKFALGKLRPQDSFNILTFSDAVTAFAPEPVTATLENRQRADAFVDDIVADGGTNIGQSLKDGLAMFPEKGSGNTLLFFTDGLPTVGTRSQEQIIRNAVEVNQKKARVFVFGVGYDVDVPFLDQVALSLRGDADYVRPDEDIEVKTSHFVAKTSAPVLENLKLTLDGTKTAEIYPRPSDLPDLFAGSQLVLVGRYIGQGKATLTLTGQANGRPQTFSLAGSFPAVDTKADFLPRLWASRKIGYLMDEVRLRPEADVKKEMIDQIIALSREFGILTPYTAMFVPEPGTGNTALAPGTRSNLSISPRGGARASRSQAGRSGGSGGSGNLAANGPSRQMAGYGGSGGGAATPTTPTTSTTSTTPAATVPAEPWEAYSLKDAPRQGEVAVNVSQANRAQKSQVVVGNAVTLRAKEGADRQDDTALARRIQNIASRTFYQQGSQWTDANYDPKTQKEVVKVKLYSPAYFALTRRNAALAKWAAVGEEVLIAVNTRQAICFGKEGKEKLTEAELTELAGKAPKTQ